MVDNRLKEFVEQVIDATDNEGGNGENLRPLIEVAEKLDLYKTDTQTDVSPREEGFYSMTTIEAFKLLVWFMKLDEVKNNNVNQKEKQ
jgi:hypothetical protein